MSRITGDQLEFLEAQEVEQRKLLETKSFAKFWPLVFENWFKRYPERAALFPDIPMDQPLTKAQEDELGVAIQKRQTGWFRWRMNASRAKCAANRQQPNLMSALASGKSRARNKVEIYSEKFFTQKVKPLLDAEVAAGNVNSRGGKLVAGQRICHDLLENEDEEVIAEINRIYEAEIEAERCKRSEEQEKGEETDRDAIAAALDDLPAALTNLFEVLSKKTRWKFSCVMAGPDPWRDWDITTMSFHLGQTPMGCDFATFRTDVEQTLMSAYAEFAELAFRKYGLPLV
ncbi:hypothetical protein JVT61DRAFT_11481 [Boletus reticuloceps]|uniref:Uncharacterized protein n=1 Tax=Boletus reticuloceps TaxID=495285 RepID=A0A8I2YWN2_9AGAM|nr:hypothetical protein JVT61DRAFT_11481 [Boletus reticuloceps]